MKTLLGQQIREQRRKKGWTMDKLAEKADLSVNYVGDLERGVKMPNLDTFIRIVEALDVPADVLIRDSAAPASYVADDELNRKLSRLTSGQKTYRTSKKSEQIIVGADKIIVGTFLSGSAPGGYITEP